MPKIKSIIKSHNHKILRPNDTNKTCNCRDKITCPFNGEFQYKGVYKSTIINGNETKKVLWLHCGIFQEQIHITQT